MAALVLLSGIGFGCAEYKRTRAATYSISDVHVTTDRSEIADCRPLGLVDSRDAARCGLTVQPTPEECMRFQVRNAGGDTLLVRGPIGDAFDCSQKTVTPPSSAGAIAASSAPPPAPPVSPPPAATPSAPPPPAATPVAVPAPPVAPPPAPAPASRSAVRVVASRDMARGCVYLGDVDLKVACPDEPGRSPDCVSDRAAEAGGNVVFLDGSRAQVFSCEPTP